MSQGKTLAFLVNACSMLAQRRNASSILLNHTELSFINRRRRNLSWSGLPDSSMPT
jgi:hypothetical protein